MSKPTRKSALQICNSRCLQWHREIQKKQEKLQITWFLRNKERLYKNLEKGQSSVKYEAALKALRDEFIKQKGLTRENQILKEPAQKSKLWKQPNEDDTVDHDLMRPINPETMNIIYVDKQASFRSRKQYFKERYNLKPEDRFYFPYCTSFVYGWRNTDYPLPSNTGFGRKAVTKASFYRRNASSLQRDPDWYRMCQSTNSKNFNEILTY